MNSAVGVGLELVVAGDGREEVALPTLRFEGRGTASAGGTIAAHVDADVGGLAGRGGAVDGGEGQATGLAIGVVEVGGRDGDEGAQIAEAGEGGVVPEDAVAARGDEEGDDDVGVVLPEIEVVALDVGDAELHLAEAVEGLVGLGVPALLDVECVFALHGGGLRVRLPAASERIAWPAASVKETAPELRSTMTCSLAVVRTKAVGHSASFQPVVREGLETTSSEARLKRSAERAKATRTMLSERSWMRRSPESRWRVRPLGWRSIFAGVAGAAGVAWAA